MASGYFQSTTIIFTTAVIIVLQDIQKGGYSLEFMNLLFYSIRMDGK